MEKEEQNGPDKDKSVFEWEFAFFIEHGDLSDCEVQKELSELIGHVTFHQKHDHMYEKESLWRHWKELSLWDLKCEFPEVKDHDYEPTEPVVDQTKNVMVRASFQPPVVLFVGLTLYRYVYVIHLKGEEEQVYYDQLIWQSVQQRQVQNVWVRFQYADE